MTTLRIGRGLAALVSVFALLHPSQARGQTTGGISGTIVDANTQSAVPDAVVIATSPQLQGEQTAVTDASGNFEITLLPAGTYRINVQREGYQAFTQDGLTVRLDRTIRIKLAILPDQFQGAAVEIVAQKPVISVSSTTTGGTVSKEQMSLVPYGRAARSFEQVATSIPGVHTDATGISMNGTGGPEQNFIIDGVQVNDPAVGTQGTTLIQDFIQEVDIKTGGYQAEYGRATGGIINVVTKSGGNDFHGSVFVNWSPFEAARNQVNALGSSISTQAKQRYNLDFGVELGGPILKDKLWFYAGFAPQLLSTEYDRVISAQRPDANGAAVIDPATGAPALTEVARKAYNQTATSYQFTGKLTYLVNENHTLALAVYGNPTTQSGPIPTLTNTLGTTGEGGFLADEQFGSTDVSLRYSGKLLNKTMLVEATGAYHHQYGGARAPTINFVQINGVSAQDVRNAPAVRYRGILNLLDPRISSDPLVPDYQSSAAVQAACAITSTGFNPCPVNNYITGGFGFVNSATLDRVGGSLKLSNFVDLLGHHQFKYGVDVARDTYSLDKFYTGGQFFDALFSGGSVTQYRGIRGFGQADPANPGQPLRTSDGSLAGGEVFTNTHNTSIAVFAQDTWNILDKLTLNIGIRGEKQLMYADPHTLDENGNPIGDKAGINLTNIMPRIGLIYDFTGRGLSKVYASYGRFYEYVPLDMADRALSAETQVTYTTNPGACTNPNDPRTCAIIPNGQPNGRTYTFTGGSAGTAVDPNLSGQYADEYNAGVQYQVYRDISVGVDYVHKGLGRVIEDMSVDDGNTYFLSNPGEQGKLGYAGTTGTGLTVLEPKPKRVYDGITVSLNKQLSDNYLFTASYTYSQFRGNYPGLFSASTGQLDPNILSAYDLLSLLPNQDGPLPGDIPNSFKADMAYIYELNSKTSINFGGNVRVDQGQPVNYLGAHPLYGQGEAYILPRGAAGRLPWQYQINLRAAAAYKISKDYNLGLTVDLFNVTNAQPATSVDQNYTFDSVSPIVNGKPSDLKYLKNTAGAPATVNPNFLAATQYQLPFSARIGAKLSF